jgi:hypothetical protein
MRHFFVCSALLFFNVAGLAIDADKKRSRFFANEHQYQVTLSADPLINGRLAIGFQLALSDCYLVDFFLSADNYRFGQYLLQFSTPQNLTPIFLQWEFLAGAGFRLRVSEWSSKTGLYMESTLSAGYYEQEFDHRTYNSIRIRPGFYMGLETLLDSGIVIGGKLGAEYPIDIYLKKEGLAVSGLFSLVPILNVGYAW